MHRHGPDGLADTCLSLSTPLLECPRQAGAEFQDRWEERNGERGAGAGGGGGGEEVGDVGTGGKMERGEGRGEGEGG